MMAHVGTVFSLKRNRRKKFEFRKKIKHGKVKKIKKFELRVYCSRVREEIGHLRVPEFVE